MKLAIPTLMSRLNESRRVECDGFYDGAHGTPLETGVEEIEGKFEEKKANLQREAITNQKRLEAEIKHLDEIGPAVERKVRAVEEKNGEEQLSIVLPVCVVLLALLAIISEALLLAPAMDILNVTNEIAQLFTAFGIAAVAGLTFHFVWESFVSEAFPKIWKVTVRLVAAMLAFGLKALDEERKQWKSIYSLHHDRGAKHGAKQEPYWIVIAKATFAALFAMLAAGWFIFFISPFFVLFPVVVWWAAFLYYRRQWRTPSRIEFFDLEHVQFMIPAKDAHAADSPVGAFGRVRRESRKELSD